MKNLEQEHIVSLLARESLRTFPSAISMQLHQLVMTYPVAGSGLAWSRIEHGSHFVLGTEDEMLTWLQQRRVASTGLIGVAWSINEPGIVIPVARFPFVFDEVWWKKPGRQFFFSAKVDEETVSINGDAVGEWNGMSQFYAV
jgi:hypothetical protein